MNLANIDGFDGHFLLLFHIHIWHSAHTHFHFVIASTLELQPTIYLSFSYLAKTFLWQIKIKTIASNIEHTQTRQKREIKRGGGIQQT